MSEKKMIIDGIECPFTDERNVLEVARHNGIDIPSLCYCENLSIYGGCRLCLVENDRGALDAACSMQPRNGLVVHTHTRKVLESRRTTLQLLMSSHRAECLTCEESGRCKLQEYAHRYNVVEPRFSENTYSRERLDVSSPCITRDPSKCILCGLCVRMCSEVQNIGAIDFTKRGKKAIVAPGFGKMLIETGCVGCGQCAAVCPTGAITINRQIPEMWRMINDPDKRVVVQFAPSVRVGLAEEFGMPATEPVTGKIVTALRRLGVDVVYDTNLSADLTIMEESAEFLEKVKTGAKLPMFTSCCPGWIQHVEKAHPNLMPQVSTCGSPMEMLGALIRQQFMIFGVTGGVTEAVIRRVLDDASPDTLKTIAECGVRGLEGIKAFTVTAGDLTLRIAVANGLGNADALIEKVESGEEYFDFIEVMACPNGCIGGGGQPPASNARKAERCQAIFKADEQCELKIPQQNPALDYIYDNLLQGRAHDLLHIHYPLHGHH